MKKCSYCGREGEDAAQRCRECGTEFYSAPPSGTSIMPILKSWLRHPAHVVWLLAALLMAQAALRLSPYDGRSGEGDVDRIDSVIRLWVSAGISTILFSLGLYLKTPGKEQRGSSSMEAP